ncbi:MAG TPA: DNA-directed RNA polymerase subunit RpoH/Rpb5 C-terminal domain-containing protein [Candidatus Nanoarchaeia archaeon]|nr:DNA-directed RNA polymerase subunit RpoH/Rpb5 C-terminal domain-containing protein [Candidatus Nanoarchaeia archaeon]
MHTLQPKHSKLSEKETEELLKKLNISKSQLPKILSGDAALPENCKIGDIIKIERNFADKKTIIYYRVVI